MSGGSERSDGYVDEHNIQTPTVGGGLSPSTDNMFAVKPIHLCKKRRVRWSTLQRGLCMPQNITMFCIPMFLSKRSLYSGTYWYQARKPEPREPLGKFCINKYTSHVF